MAKENVIKVKKFPTFWTFLKRNGETTIHQVRFKCLLTLAQTEHVQAEDYDRIEIVKSVFDIAGTNAQWIGGECSMGGNYHDLALVFATKEDAIAASQSNKEADYLAQFGGLCRKDGWYRIKRNSILHRSEWVWSNHIPNNMTIVHRNGLESFLGGYCWNGIKTILNMAYYDYSNGVEVCGTKFRRLGSVAAFDMVTCNYIGKPTKDYFKTKEECERQHNVQVFEFDD